MSHTTAMTERQPDIAPDTPDAPEPGGPEPTGLTGAPARLWAALTKLPGATAAELADAARIGRSTAGKTLATLETTGTASRQPGGFDGKRRLPDHWYATTPPTDTDDPATPDDQPATTEAEPETGQNPTDEASHTARGTNSTELPDEPDPTPEAGPEPLPPAEAEPQPSQEAEPEPDPEPQPNHHTEPQPNSVLVAGEGPDDAPAPAPASAVASSGGADTASASAGRQRLAPGALRERVLRFLQDRPGQEWGPTGLSRQLEASSGAISNALDRLVALGLAQRTGDKPRRFTAITQGEAQP